MKKRILRQAQDVASLRISLIITTKNETQTIGKLLDSIANQTRKPDEVVLADASTGHRPQVTGHSEVFPIHLIELAGNTNRAIGRNAAIREAKYDHILITDAGCVLKEDWVEKMHAQFIGHRAPPPGRGRQATGKKIVIAGYYEGVYENIFEKCQIPYVLVMPDKVDPDNFLPATRSMGLTRAAWEAVGGFNESYRYAEDYDFARRLRATKIPIVMASDAIVYWRPRQTWTAFARMIGEHAYGDGYAQSFRPKVLTIYGRYLIFFSLGYWQWTAGIGMFGVYLGYSIWKNYRYVRHWKAWLYLPGLQIVSDLAVMWGTIRGIVARLL